MIRSQTRREVMAEIISFMASARASGQDEFAAVRAAFPGIPEDVIAQAGVEVDAAETEAWWQTIERTIDGNVIRNALTPMERAP